MHPSLGKAWGGAPRSDVRATKITHQASRQLVWTMQHARQTYCTSARHTFRTFSVTLITAKKSGLISANSGTGAGVDQASLLQISLTEKVQTMWCVWIGCRCREFLQSTKNIQSTGTLADLLVASSTAAYAAGTDASTAGAAVGVTGACCCGGCCCCGCCCGCCCCCGVSHKLPCDCCGCCCCCCWGVSHQFPCGGCCCCCCCGQPGPVGSGAAGAGC